MRDLDVRTALLNQLATAHAGDASTLIVQEMGVWSGTVRIDIAVINGELSGYELKSERDTLDRLPLQADIYSRVFDQVTLVVGRRHLNKATDAIPSWWGVMIADMDDSVVRLSVLRPSLRNPSPEPYLLAELLRKEEAVAILDQFGLADGWRSKKIRSIHERLADELPFSILAEKVRAMLKARSHWQLRQNRSNQLDVTI